MFDNRDCRFFVGLAALGCSGESATEITSLHNPPQQATAVAAAHGTPAASALAALGANTERQEAVQRRSVNSAYAILEDDARFSAVSPAQGFRASFHTRGAELTGREDVRQSVRVGGTAIARGRHKSALGAAQPELGACRSDGAIDAAGDCSRRLEARRGPVTELWENRPDGLEHSFIVHERVKGEGELAVWVGIQNAEVDIEPDGKAARIGDARSGLSLSYSGLRAWDAQGVVLAARMQARPGGLALVVDDSNAAYPITIDPVLATADIKTIEVNQASSNYGYSVASAGDVNGDGFGDVIVGAPQFDNGQLNEGRVYVHYGTADGLAPSAPWTAESNQAQAAFGYSVAGAGDVNGDGFDDVIIGAVSYSNGQSAEGRAFVYLGSASGLGSSAAWTAESNQAGATFGYAVASAGDVNRDGFGDVIVGAYAYSNGQSNEGRAFVYHGSASGLALAPAWTGESNQATAFYGLSVAGAGDVNGDGFDDVIVSAPAYDNGQADEGVAFIYRGSAAGLSTTASWTGEGNQAFAYYGVSVASAGDVNGDGFGDVIVGAPYYDGSFSDQGRALTYHGSSSGPATSAQWVASGSQTNQSFGYSVASAGDVDADGFGDVLIGARYHDNGQTDEGAAFLHLGAAVGLQNNPAYTLEGNRADALLGSCVASAGDIDADGHSDLIVGAYLYTNGQTEEGRVVVVETATCRPIDYDELFRIISQDADQQDPEDALAYRYVTLFNRVNAVGCGPQLDGERDALLKLLNSLSKSPSLAAPIDLDGRGLIYRIDLRDYAWNESISVNGQGFVDAWEAIAAHDPYAVPFVGQDADDAVDATGTAFPILFADSLLATAAVDELYYALIGVDVNQTLDNFILNELQIDVEADFEDRELVRAGFSGASWGLPNHAFLAERHEIQVRDGYSWQISDFGGGSLGLFQHPLGQPAGERELVFTLPNGLLGFVLADSDGQLVNDSELLLDPSQPSSPHRIAVSAFAKFAQGVDVVDEVRAYVLTHPLEYDADEREAVPEIYPTAASLGARLDADRAFFPEAALASLGLDIDDPEPISASFATFSGDVDLATAAGDLMYSAEFLASDLGQEVPVIQVLGSGGTIERDVWTSNYLQSLCLLGIAMENQVDPSLCE